MMLQSLHECVGLHDRAVDMADEIRIGLHLRVQIARDVREVDDRETAPLSRPFL